MDKDQMNQDILESERQAWQGRNSSRKQGALVGAENHVGTRDVRALRSLGGSEVYAKCYGQA